MYIAKALTLYGPLPFLFRYRPTSTAFRFFWHSNCWCGNKYVCFLFILLTYISPHGIHKSVNNDGKMYGAGVTTQRPGAGRDETEKLPPHQGEHEGGKVSREGKPTSNTRAKRRAALRCCPGIALTTHQCMHAFFRYSQEAFPPQGRNQRAHAACKTCLPTPGSQSTGACGV